MPQPYSLSELNNEFHFDWPAVRRAVRVGHLERVCRGQYLISDAGLAHAEYETLIYAIWSKLSVGSAISHASAAVLHGLPLWRQTPTRVWVSRTEAAHGQIRKDVHFRKCSLPPEHLTIINGMTVTSLGRTAVDLARCLPFAAGVAAVDAALAKGCSKTELTQIVDDMQRWPGVGKAARVIAFADAASESPAESVSRVRMDEASLPRPELQFELRDAAGHLIGRFDFGWRDYGVLGECDGAGKYDEQAARGASASSLVLATTRRDRSAQDLGWRVVHWGTQELLAPHLLGAALRHYLPAAA